MIDHDRKHAAIVAAALKEFARHGFEAARESRIAREAGVSLATLRRRFPDRADLFRESVRAATLRLIESAGQDFPGDTAEEKLRAFARWCWQTMADPDHAALLRLAVGELHRFPELAVFHAAEVLGRVGRVLEGLLAEGARRGEFRHLEPRSTARVALSAFLAHSLWFAFPEIYGGLTGHARDRAEQAVVDFVLQAVRP